MANVKKTKRQFMMVFKYPRKYCSYKATQRKVSKSTKKQCTKDSNTLAHIAAMKQLQRDHLLNTKGQCTKDLNALANYEGKS